MDKINFTSFRDCTSNQSRLSSIVYCSSLLGSKLNLSPISGDIVKGDVNEKF